MPLTVEALSRDEWVSSAPREICLRLRRDGTGYYDRKEPGARIIHEKLMFKIESETLRIKFNRARLWVDVAGEIREGPGGTTDRFGRQELVLEKDPYATAIEELAAAVQLVLQSDAGASLPPA